jgi:hypothetical protein
MRARDTLFRVLAVTPNRITYRVQFVFALLQVQVISDSRVLSCETRNFFTVEIVHKAAVDLTRELEIAVAGKPQNHAWGRENDTHLVEELIKQFDIQEHGSSIC